MMSARQNAVLRRFNQSLNNWNVINVRNMNRMFKDARSFNQPLNNWDVSNALSCNILARREHLLPVLSSRCV